MKRYLINLILTLRSYFKSTNNTFVCELPNSSAVINYLAILAVHFLIVLYRNTLSTNISMIRRQELFRYRPIPPFAIPKFRAAKEKFCNFRRIGVGALLKPAFENNCNRWQLTMNGKRGRVPMQVSLFYDYRIETIWLLGLYPQDCVVL